MRYETASAFRAALEARLRPQATGDHASLVRLRKHVVFDRLLARLLVISPNQWIRKGGLAPDLAAGHARAAAFLDPVLGGTVEDADTWDSMLWRWR